MKRYLIICILFLLPLVSYSKVPGAAFAYGVDADFRFDNYEFGKSDDKVAPSKTIAAIVLTPSVGVSIAQGDVAKHRVMAGINLRHDFGSGKLTDVFREITLWYDADVKLRNGSFKGAAGVFPRRFLEGNYSEAFWSDSLKFQDRNIHGILLKYRSSSFFAELGLDWMGMSGRERRERFEIFSAGLWNAKEWLSLGWAAVMYHYAGSELAPGVVDNHKFNPYVRFDAACCTGMQELSFKAGPMLTWQRDREREKGARFPMGGEFVLTARKWNVCIQNTTYAGQNLLPYYSDLDTGGSKYGNDLYRGLQLYTGFFDRIEASWTPHITDWLSLGIVARFFFYADGFMGSQQVVSLCVII